MPPRMLRRRRRSPRAVPGRISPLAANEALRGGRLQLEQLEPRRLLAADLVVDEFWTTPSLVIEGESFELFARIRNAGDAVADAGLFANQEAVFFFDGVQQGEGDDYDNLAPGASIVVRSGSIAAPSGGDYAIRVVADGNDEVAESDETNNEATKTLAVVPKLSWRASQSLVAPLVDAGHAGATIYAHVYDPASAGDSIEIEIWEDDAPGTSMSDDDQIATLSIPLDAAGHGVGVWTAAWQGLDAAAPENAYYLFFDAPWTTANFRSQSLHVALPAPTEATLHTTPVVYDWDASPPGEGVIDVSLERRGGLSIDAAAPDTWLVIHGRNDSSSAFAPLADTVRLASGDQQVLTLDWSEGASSVFSADFSGESWIAPVAAWAVATLVDYGFASDGLNVIGHSWGGVLTGELSGRFPDGVRRVVALDPAEDAPPPFGTSYSTELVNFGADHSQFSWAFYSRDGATLGITAGSEETPTTAHEAFVVTDSGHSEVVDLFTAMIASPVGVTSRFFSLERLIAGVPGPWLTDQYDDQGAPAGDGLYESVIGSTSGGTQPASIVFSGNGTPVAAPGDYEQDDRVDGRDFLAWQRGIGTTGPGLAADGDFDQRVGRGDLRIFAANFGNASFPALREVHRSSTFDESDQVAIIGVAAQLERDALAGRRDRRPARDALDRAMATYFPRQEEFGDVIAYVVAGSTAGLAEINARDADFDEQERAIGRAEDPHELASWVNKIVG